MKDLLRVAGLARRLAAYAPILPALLDLIGEVSRDLSDRRLDLDEVQSIGQRLVDLVDLVPRS